MQEAGREARLASSMADVLENEGISQTELAHRVGVSQSTVSRALRNRPLRQGRARARLVSFMQQGGGGRGADRLQQAFRRVWDGSDEHAEALARIIAACEGLRPTASAEPADDD
jgi:transcriptional regulator with XRE-family HTH domain